MTHAIYNQVSSERRYNLSVFSDLEQSNPSYGQFDLATLSDLFTAYSNTDEKGEVPLFSGTHYKASNRQLNNALYSDLLVLDLDGTNYSYSEAELREKFSHLTFFAYETYSSSPILDKWRWRIVFPLERSVTPHEYEVTYDALIKEHRLDVDKSTKSINAIFFLPEKNELDIRSAISNEKALLKPIKHTTKPPKPLINNTSNEVVNTDIRITVSKKPSEGINDYLNGFDTPYSLTGTVSIDDVNKLTNMPGTGLLLAKLIGVDLAKTGLSVKRFKSRAIKSVLPWHNKDNKPSIGLLIKRDGDNAGRVILRSFKEEDSDNPFFDLHYIYACQLTGKKIPFEKWTKSASFVWLVRALIDCGLIEAPVINYKGPSKSSSPAVKSYFDSMMSLCKVRGCIAHYADDNEVPYSFSFAEIWSGCSRQSASKYMKILVDEGVVEGCYYQTLRMKIPSFIPKVINHISELSPFKNEYMVERPQQEGRGAFEVRGH